MISDETVKQIAKTTGTALELAGKAGAFVNKVIGGPLEQVGEMFTDRMRLFRFKNLCAVADKVEAIISKRKLEGKTNEIPARLAIPMLEAAAVEDDESLQDVWAGLIANAMDPNVKIAIHPSYIEIARQLTSDEAMILINLPKYRKIAFQMLIGDGVKDITIVSSKDREIPATPLTLKRPNEIMVYMNNLFRLQMLTPPVKEGDYASVTPFAISFLRACNTMSLDEVAQQIKSRPKAE